MGLMALHCITARSITGTTVSYTHLDVYKRQVDGAFGTQANADAALWEFTEKDSGLDTGNAEGVVDDSLAVFVGGTGADHVFVGDGEPGDAVITLEIGDVYKRQKWRRSSIWMETADAMVVLGDDSCRGLGFFGLDERFPK